MEGFVPSWFTPCTPLPPITPPLHLLLLVPYLFTPPLSRALDSIFSHSRAGSEGGPPPPRPNRKRRTRRRHTPAPAFCSLAL
ncbi:hypothetical protein BKA81DRAFT_354330 [Phyllosticta paracitricarpa]